MKSASDLTEEQKQTVHRWAEEGACLQDIQGKLDEEFGLRFTFMETRFLAGDLKLTIKSEVKEEPEKEETAAEDTGGELDGGGDPQNLDSEFVPDDAGGAATAAPAVTVDQITTPGTLISGKVTFSGGKIAAWSLDQYGRLSLNPDDIDFRPSEEEVMAFQQELQKVARKQGL